MHIINRDLNRNEITKIPYALSQLGNLKEL